MILTEFPLPPHPPNSKLLGSSYLHKDVPGIRAWHVCIHGLAAFGVWAKCRLRLVRSSWPPPHSKTMTPESQWLVRSNGKQVLVLCFPACPFLPRVDPVQEMCKCMLGVCSMLGNRVNAFHDLSAQTTMMYETEPKPKLSQGHWCCP